MSVDRAAVARIRAAEPAVAIVPPKPDPLKIDFDAEGDRYFASWDHPSEIDFEFSRLRAERGDLYAEVIVSEPFRAQWGDETILQSRVNLISPRSRADLARSIAKRSLSDDPELQEYRVDDACRRVVAAYRKGEPPIVLAAMAPPPVEDRELVEGLVLRHDPMTIFGDGSSLKSLLALALAGAIAGGQPFLGRRVEQARVAYLDWEFSPEEHRRRAGRLFTVIPPDLLYVPCAVPLADDLDRLQGIVRDQRIGYIIVDSIGAAMGGAPEAAETSLGFYRALRSLGVGSLLVAHITKAEGGDQKPFGSVMHYNMARSAWYIQKSKDTDAAHVLLGLYHRKSNAGRLLEPIGIEVGFEDPDGPIVMNRADVHLAADLAGKLPLWERIAALLRGGALEQFRIADELEATPDAVRMALKRSEGKRFVRLIGPDGVERWGLLSHEG